MEEQKQPEIVKKETIPCEYHKTESKAPHKHIVAPKITEQTPSCITQLVFSHNLQYVAALVSGGVNGIVVFEW